MHYSDDELANYSSIHRANAAHQARMEQHLSECAECRETLALFDDLEDSLRKPEVWAHVPEFRTPSPRLEQLLAEHEAIERQNEDAARRLAPYLESWPQFERANVAEDERFQHAGAVRMLTSQATELCERQPRFAYLVATAAVTIASKLDPHLHGVALRERANALRYLGEFKEALSSLDKAEVAFGGESAQPFDLAILQYIRSTVIIQFEERSAEALEVARGAIKTFREYGDRKRELAARLVEAEALKAVSGSEAAATAYEAVICLARHQEKEQILAYALRNAALCCTEAGDLDGAERHHAEALTIYDDLGITVEIAKTEWELARLLVLRGQLEAGAEALQAARTRLYELELHDDHDLATLDWAGVRLALDRPEGVAAACREIMPRYESEGATRNARLAMAYLHEALRKGEATPALVHRVRDYLAQLPAHPAAVFQPLA